MRNLVLGAVCLSLLVACEQQDVCENDEVVADNLRIEAEISASGVASRTTTTAEGKVTFAENDKIGFYAPQTVTSGSWTYSQGSWTPSEVYTWPDKQSVHNFCAYYPFAGAVARDAVTMPDLSNQKGLADELNVYDFLVARCAAGYETKQGVVSFTGEQAFKHVYSLIAVTLKADAETNGSALTAISLKAENLMTPHTYHFGASAEDDGMTQTGEQVNELSLTGLDATISTEGIKQVYIVNPLHSAESVVITINYNREGCDYTASTAVSAEGIQGGTLNKLNITIKKSGLVVEGNTVEDWTVTDLDDVVVEENPAANS